MISARRVGTIPLKPVTMMPREAKLVKPHKAKVRISRLRGDSPAPPPLARSR